MSVAQHRPPEVIRVRTIKPETAESILAALENAINERMLASVACGDLTARHLAIYELTLLVNMPDSETRRARVNKLIDEFGAEDVARWLSRIVT